jgi:hypothetical protein
MTTGESDQARRLFLSTSSVTTAAQASKPNQGATSRNLSTSEVLLPPSRGMTSDDFSTDSLKVSLKVEI